MLGRHFYGLYLRLLLLRVHAYTLHRPLNVISLSFMAVTLMLLLVVNVLLVNWLIIQEYVAVPVCNLRYILVFLLSDALQRRKVHM